MDYNYISYPPKYMPRTCSICSHKQLKKINSLINEPKSFRVISRQICGSEKMHDSIRRHTQNCLNLEIAALIKQKKIENAIDHYQEISEQLQLARDLRLAARKYLSDPDTGELTLIPRADEISVVYEDLNDTGPKGAPKRKTDNLDILLERAKAGGVHPTRAIIKHVDIRSFALNAISSVDMVLDKIARKEGLYQQDKQNNDELIELKKIIELLAQKTGTTYQEELKDFIENYAPLYKPDLVDKLVSELEN